ncbi:hypothetical protein ACFXDJ_16565 [Streptomyces sp. NPDC059443]|uniref:hypothetical protein n=1 Tax=unclassified Streptomyces TaxID=2593676 RepID=UPI0036B28F35
MDGFGTDQVLASKWDAAYAVGVVLRALFSTLPDWAKWIIAGLGGATALWEGCQWWRRRRTAVR